MAQGQRKISAGAAGFSLIEVMVASAGVIGFALAINSLFLVAKKTAIHSDFYDLCSNAVRSKLNEYRSGTVVDLSSQVVAVPSLGTVPTLSTDSGATGTLTSGFAYAKLRYNTAFSGYCPASAGACAPGTSCVPAVGNTVQSLLQPVSNALRFASLGLQECAVGLGTGIPPDCSGVPADTALQQNLPGFKLFVNLRRYNPLFPALPGTASGALEDCYVSSGPAGNYYDFQWAGDMIKVTVTGLLDLAGPPARTFDGIKPGDDRALNLSCQVTDLLRPQTFLSRYQLSNQKIYRTIGLNSGSVSAASYNYEVFHSVTAPYLASGVAIASIAVSPDDSTLFVLQNPGSTLRRYGPCGGVPLDCTATPSACVSSNPLQCPGGLSGEWSLGGSSAGAMKVIAMTAVFGPLAANGAGYEHFPYPLCGRPNHFPPGSHGGLAGYYPVILGLAQVPGNSALQPVCFDTNQLPGVPNMPAVPLTAVFNLGIAPVTGQTNIHLPFVAAASSNGSQLKEIFSDAGGFSTYTMDGSCTTIGTILASCQGVYGPSDFQRQYPLDLLGTQVQDFSK